MQVRPAYAKFDALPRRSQESTLKREPNSPEKGTGSELSGASIADALLNAFETNNRINQYLIDNLPAAAWDAKPLDGKGRTIRAIVAHIRNVRVMWLKAAKADEIPEQLDRATATQTQAKESLEASRDALSAVIRGALRGDGRVKGFRPEVAGFLGYLIAHDAHHRGQITMLAR